jgi:hypothetical protein
MEVRSGASQRKDFVLLVGRIAQLANVLRESPVKKHWCEPTSHHTAIPNNLPGLVSKFLRKMATKEVSLIIYFTTVTLVIHLNIVRNFPSLAL